MNPPMNLALRLGAECRRCGKQQQIEVSSKEVPFDDDVKRLIQTLHDHGYQREGWADGYCPACLEHQFLDEADKADHDHKCQRELDP